MSLLRHKVSVLTKLQRTTGPGPPVSGWPNPPTPGLRVCPARPPAPGAAAPCLRLKESSVGGFLLAPMLTPDESTPVCSCGGAFLVPGSGDLSLEGDTPHINKLGLSVLKRGHAILFGSPVPRHRNTGNWEPDFRLTESINNACRTSANAAL